MRKSSKIAFAASLVAGSVLAACLFAGIVRTVGRDCIVTEIWLPDVLKMKRLFAERTPSPRIIVSAGSGAMFGVDSGVLSETLGLPVVNMALHAALPLEFYCAELRRIARPGDIVLMPLEIRNFYEVSFADKLSRDVPISMVFGVAPEYASVLSPSERILFYLRYGLEWICRNLRGQTHRSSVPVAELEKKWREDRNDADYGGYKFGGLSERGDMLIRRPGLPLQDKKWEVPTALSESFVVTWKSFVSEMKARGIRVILTWGNLLWYPDREGFGNLRRLLADVGISLNGRPEAFSFPAQCYYDTHFHLNAYGAALNAVELAKIVAPILGRPLKLPPSAVAHRAFAEDPRSAFPAATDSAVYATGVRLPAGSVRMHLDVPPALRGKSARLNLILEQSASEALSRVLCRGVNIPVRRTPHAFRDEIMLSLSGRQTKGKSLDLTFVLSAAVGFERMTWLESAPTVRFCSGFAGEWTLGNRAEVELAVPQAIRGKDAVVRLSLKPSEERITVFCGSTPLGRYDLTWDAVELKIPVPRRLTDGETLRIRLELERVKTPKERGWSSDDRKLGPRVVSIGLEQ